MEPIEQLVATIFHTMYYYSAHTWNNGNTKWMGIPVLQNPLDMWILQEIICETKPELIIETGSAVGGSSLFYVSISDFLEVISIDTQKEMRSQVDHPRIKFMKGRSTDKKIVDQVRRAVKGKRTMVILDSDHSAENVLKEMTTFGPLVTPGCYMVVCDTNLGGNPIQNGAVPGPGPMGGLQQFLDKDKGRTFEIDKGREKFYMTFFPNGWLRKK